MSQPDNKVARCDCGGWKVVDAPCPVCILIKEIRSGNSNTGKR